MDRQAIDDLQAEYPNRPIICIPPHQPTECVIEVLKGQKLGVAVALIDRSQSHRHRLTTEEIPRAEGRSVPRDQPRQSPHPTHPHRRSGIRSTRSCITLLS